MSVGPRVALLNMSVDLSLRLRILSFSLSFGSASVSEERMERRNMSLFSSSALIARVNMSLRATLD